MLIHLQWSVRMHEISMILLEEEKERGYCDGRDPRAMSICIYRHPDHPQSSRFLSFRSRISSAHLKTKCRVTISNLHQWRNFNNSSPKHSVIQFHARHRSFSSAIIEFFFDRYQQRWSRQLDGFRSCNRSRSISQCDEIDHSILSFSQSCRKTKLLRMLDWKFYANV